jgi:WS/DGAT/MGAT family acyltransferase
MSLHASRRTVGEDPKEREMSKQRMSTADAAWLHMDRPTNLMVVNSVMWTGEPIDRDRARAIVEERLVDRFPRFSQRIAEPTLGLGVPSWEDDPDFDLDVHLHHLALPAPGGPAELQRLVADLMTQPLDRNKPLWHSYLVEGYGGGSAMITRIHHCIADGIALARLLLSLTDEEPGAGIAPPRPDASRPGPVEMLAAGAHVAEAALHEGIELLNHPRAEGRNLAGTAIADGRALGKLLLTGSDAQSVLKGRLGVARRVTWSDGLPLERIKRIGHRAGATVNDVMLAAVTGALHGYLKERDALVDEIRVMVPFNLRALDKPLPRELGNRFGLVYLQLPVGIADRRARLAAVHEEMERIKRTPEGAVSYAILGAIGMTPLPLEQRIVDVFTTKATAVMTNVPGPRRPVYFAGAKVEGVLGWVPAGGDIGLGVSIFSYDGKITVGVQSDAGLVGDPEVIVARLEDELAALGRLRAPRPAAEARPRAAARAAVVGG